MSTVAKFSVARIGGNHGRLAKTKVLRESTSYDKQVVSELQRKDGKLRDLEALGRLYIETTEDGTSIPLFAHGEIPWMNVVGLPVYIEHCYPRGVKFPTGRLLEKDAYGVPMPESIPIGKVTHVYPDIVPGELWVRVSVDPSGLDQKQETALRSLLIGKLSDMSIAFAHSGDVNDLADGLGVPFHGGLLQLMDGTYARLFEASFVTDADVPLCKVALVKASRKRPNSTCTIDKRGMEGSGDTTTTASSGDPAPMAVDIQSTPNAEHPTLITPSENAASVIRTAPTMGEFKLVSQANQPPTLQQAAAAQQPTIIQRTPPQRPIAYDFQPERQVANKRPAIMADDVPMDDAARSSSSRSQQQAAPAATTGSAEQQKQPSGGSTPSSGTVLPASQQQAPASSQKTSDVNMEEYKSLKAQLESTRLLVPHIGSLASKLAMSQEDAYDFLSGLPADKLQRMIDAQQRAGAIQQPAPPQQQQQQAADERKTGGGQQSGGRGSGYQTGGGRTGGGKSLSDQNMDALMEAAKNGPIGASGGMDRKRGAPTADEDMEITGSTTKSARRDSSGDSAAGRRQPDFQGRGSSATTASGAVGSAVQEPANSTADLIRRLEELSKNPAYSRALYADPAIRATLASGFGGPN